MPKNIDINNFLKIIKSFEQNKGFLIVFNVENVLNKEFRINIPLKREALYHCLGFSRNHLPNEIINSRKLKKQILSKPEKFLNEMNKRLSKKIFGTLLNKFRSFIEIFDKLLNNDIDKIKILKGISFNSYKGDYCLIVNNHMLVLEINTSFPRVDHHFFNCHIKSIRQYKVMKNELNNNLLKIINLIIRKTKK